MTLPLSNLLVISLEQAVAAPMCSCRLADAGARVIKIERPEGDFARYYDRLAQGESAYFVWLNRGKESVCLDLMRPDDKALLSALLARADVFIQNLKPGAIAKLGFPLDRLHREHPRLVICSISGYGERGPYSARKAYDKARKSATAEELELGAMRYAAVRSEEDPKFTKHAATWLNNKCWLDEPEPARAANFGERPQSFQRSAPLSHVEIALAGLKRDD